MANRNGKETSDDVTMSSPTKNARGSVWDVWCVVCSVFVSLWNEGPDLRQRCDWKSRETRRSCLKLYPLFI